MPNLIHAPARQKPVYGIPDLSYAWMWDDLILAWMNFDGSTTAVKDYATADQVRHPGTPTGIIVTRDPVFGPVWNFDGSTSQITTGLTGSLAGRVQTYDLWFKTTTNYSGKKCAIYSNQLSTGLRGITIGLTTGNLIFANAADSSAVRTTITGSKIVNDGNWHHVFLVYDGNTQFLAGWLDGGLWGTGLLAVAGAPTGATQSLGIPLDVTDFANFTGQVALLRVWGLKFTSGAVPNTGPGQFTSQGVGVFKSPAIPQLMFQEPFAMFLDPNILRRYMPLTGNKILTATLAATSGAETASILGRTIGKVLKVTDASNSSLIRFPSRSLSYAVTSVNKLLHGPTRTLSVSDGDSTSIIKQPGKVLISNSGDSPSLLRTPIKLLTSSGVSASSLVRAPSRFLTYTVTSLSKLVRNPALTISTVRTTVPSIVRSVGKLFSASGVSNSTMARNAGRILSYVVTSVSSLIRAPATTLNAIFLSDGVISGGIYSVFTGLQIQLSIQRVRLNGLVGGMTINNSLLVSAGHPTLDRIDTVWAFGPAGYTGANSAPNPPGYDVERIEGTPSLTPVAPGFSASFIPGNPYVNTGFASPYYFTALCSYRVPAGATASSQFTNVTDLRSIVPDGPYSESGVSISTLSRTPSTSLTGHGTSISSLIRSPIHILSYTITSIPSLLKSPSIILAAVAVSSASRVDSVLTTLSGSGTSVSTLTRLTQFLLSASGISVATRVFQPARTLSAVNSDNTTMGASPSTSLSAGGTGLAAFVRVPAIVLLVVITSISTLIAVGTSGVTFLIATGVSSANFVRRVFKNLLSSGVSSSELDVIGNRVLTSHGTSIASLVRAPSRALKYTVTTVVSFIKRPGHILASTGIGSSVLNTLRGHTLSATGISTSLIKRAPARILKYTVVTVRNLVKLISKTLVTSSGDQAEIGIGGAKTLTLDTLPTGIPSILVTPMKTLSVVAVSVAHWFAQKFVFVAHLFSIVRVYKRWEFDSYQIYQVNRIYQRFSRVASTIYKIRRVYRKW